MLATIIRWFHAPLFPEDEEKTRRAMLLNAVLNTFLIALPVLFISSLLGARSPRFERNLMIIASAWLTIFGTRLLMCSGRVATAGTVAVIILFISTTLALYNLGTIRAPATSFYFLAIVTAGLTINRRAILWTSGLSATAIIALLLGEINNFLPAPNYTVSATQGITFIVVFAVIAILLYLSVKRIDDTLAHIREELTERASAKEKEKIRRQMMEKVVQIGKAITEPTSDLRATLLRIWNGVRNELDFDRAAVFLYNPNNNTMQGSYGTDRSGRMSEEWDLIVTPLRDGMFLRPDGLFFTQDYENEFNITSSPEHPMRGVKQYAAVGCWSGDKPVGMICVDQLISGRVITEEQLETLRFFAGYAGLAIENARRSEHEQKRQELMEQVIQIGKSVTQPTSDFRATLLKVWDGVHNGLGFDRTAIFLYDQKNELMQGSYGTDRLGNLSEEWDLKFGIGDNNSFFRTVLSQRDGYYFTRDYAGERNLHLRPGHPMGGVKHYVAVAVWAGDKPVAIICVDQLMTGRIISDEQLEAVRLFAGYAGLAIENARLIEREQKRRGMMETVIQIGKEVTGQTTDLRQTLLKIRNCVRNILDFDRASIFLYDPGDQTVRGSYGTNHLGELTDEWDLKFKPLQNGFLQRVLSQPNGFHHTANYEEDLKSAPDNIMQGVKHYVAAACWSGDKPIAVICADQLISGRIITDEQLEALRLFAGYAGLAIENTRLNAELEKRIDELGNRNSELERFTYTVSHDLRSPLVTIKGFLGMLKKDLYENKPDRITSDMQRIAGATDKMDTLLSDLLELSRVGRVINPPEEIDLVQLTYTTLETIDGRLRAKNITTHVAPDLPTLYADRIRISEVLANLIDNAAKYMGAQTQPCIEIGHRSNETEQVIYVKDNGMGIESQHLQRVFGLFEKLNPTSEGTGIGLALIKRIVETHGGKIWVESEGLGHGSTFCFTIPDNR